MKEKLALFVLIGLLLGITASPFFGNKTLQSELKPLESVNSVGEKTRIKKSLSLLSAKVSPNGFYRGESFSGDYNDRYNYYQIFVTVLNTERRRKIYSGTFRTSGWEWTDDSKIEITHNCGTGCRATKVIDIAKNVAISEEKKGLITKENGWKIEFFKSF